MDMLQGKHFSITDPKGVNTVIYQINETEKEFLKEEIEDKLGYIVGFLNADKEHSWGIR